MVNCKALLAECICFLASLIYSLPPLPACGKISKLDCLTSGPREVKERAGRGRASGERQRQGEEAAREAARTADWNLLGSKSPPAAHHAQSALLNGVKHCAYSQMVLWL